MHTKLAGRNIQNVFIMLFVLVLSACSTNSANRQASRVSAPIQYDDMYLRGVFNWWEASENYKFEAQSTDMYKASIELIADGQPYDFKVSDSKWTAYANCGQASSDEMILGDAVSLVCQENSLNLRFLPSETGTFDFYLDTSNPYVPELTIEAASQ